MSNAAFFASALHNENSGGFASMTVTDSTISGNLQRGTIVSGGALAAVGGAVVQVANSTFSDIASGAIAALVNNAVVHVGNTILKSLAPAANINVDVGIVVSHGFNLVSDIGGGFFQATGDQTNSDPKLGPLQDNGSPTPTHMLLPGSPAIDQGVSDAIPALKTTVDQRGLPRTIDDPSIANASLGDGTDIGAVEVRPAPVPAADLLLGVDKTSVKMGDTLTYTVTVKNLGPDTAPNVVVNDVLSSGTTFVSAKATRGTFGTPPPGKTGTVTWNIPTLANGDLQAAQIKVTVIVNAKTTASIVNSVSAASDATDPNAANNTASIMTPVANGGGKK